MRRGSEVPVTAGRYVRVGSRAANRAVTAYVPLYCQIADQICERELRAQVGKRDGLRSTAFVCFCKALIPLRLLSRNFASEIPERHEGENPIKVLNNKSVIDPLSAVRQSQGRKC
jgi:hypothetical protein